MRDCAYVEEVNAALAVKSKVGRRSASRSSNACSRCCARSKCGFPSSPGKMETWRRN